MRTLTKKLRTAAMIGVLGVLAACGQGAPSGYTTAAQSRLQLAVPQDWVAGETSGSVDLVRQDREGNDPALRLAAMSDYPDKSAQGALGQVRTLNLLGKPDDSGGMAEVAGERDMWRWDLTTDEGATQIIAWALCDRTPNLCVVITLVSKGPIDDALAKEIEDSVEILPASD